MQIVLALIVFLSPFWTGESKEMSDRKKQVKTFLKNISEIESAGGTNYNHDLIQKGIHKGHKAIGRYGLMPNTVNETLVRMKRKGKLTPELQSLKGMDAAALKQKLEENPELEDQLAEHLADRVLSRQGDEEKAAYSWHQGHNLNPEDIETRKYQEHDYVKKYKNLKKLMGENNE